ncbi:type II toxin-antitoxin system PemK/MazF family toxin [Patescibacteria group bacterium]
MIIHQFDVWLVNLNLTKGSEQNGERPCIILQTNASGDHGATTLIAPCTTKKLNKIHSFQVMLEPSNQNGLTKISKIKFDQIRVIDKIRLLKKLGDLEKTYHTDIVNAIKVIFDLEKDFTI